MKQSSEMSNEHNNYYLEYLSMGHSNYASLGLLILLGKSALQILPIITPSLAVCK